MPCYVPGFSKVVRERGDWSGARALEVLIGTLVDAKEMNKNKPTKNILNQPEDQITVFIPLRN